MTGSYFAAAWCDGRRSAKTANSGPWRLTSAAKTAPVIPASPAHLVACVVQHLVEHLPHHLVHHLVDHMARQMLQHLVYQVVALLLYL